MASSRLSLKYRICDFFLYSWLFFKEKSDFFEKNAFFYEKKLYFFIGRSILLDNGRKMPYRHRKDSHIKRQNLTLWRTGGIHWKRDVSRLMEIFVNKMDMSIRTRQQPIRDGSFFLYKVLR